jgi:cytochrome c oxidase subunit II
VKNLSSKFFLFISLGFLSANPIHAQETDDEYSYCFLCHGASGQGNIAIQAPAIAGISESYLHRQLDSYRNAYRGSDYSADPAGAEMLSVAQQLTSAQNEGIINFLAPYKNQSATHSGLDGDADEGKAHYEQQCSACHGNDGQGSDILMTDALTNLNDWYLVSSFNKYRDGTRGGNPDDTPAHQMHLFVQALPEDFPINDIAAYLRSKTISQ